MLIPHLPFELGSIGFRILGLGFREAGARSFDSFYLLLFMLAFGQRLLLLNCKAGESGFDNLWFLPFISHLLLRLGPGEGWVSSNTCHENSKVVQM